MRKQSFVIAAFFAAIPGVVLSAEIGHFNPGILDMRDYFLPAEPGIYGALYNYYYTTDRLNDGNGNKIGSLTFNAPSGAVRANLQVTLNTYAVFPAFFWVSPWEILGARYGVLAAPCFANNSLEAKLFIADEVAGKLQNSTLGPGDPFVQPVWLDWAKPHWDISLAYAFYAPVGKYNARTVTAFGTDVRVVSSDNIGLGYWTQQVQGGIAWYPMTNKATAVTAVLTYQYNGKQQDFELKPGQMLTLNWGVSQDIPLDSNHKLLLDVGPAGYDAWQITDSTGADAFAPGSHSQVHAIGGQLGLIYAPWGASLVVHGFYEYAAVSRFQGASLGVNLGIKF